jgi:hypothetical protein
MIFSRRTFKSNRNFKVQSGLFSHPVFQRKYVYYLVMTMTGLALFFYIPTIYFLSQNYDLIAQLAYDTHPSLVESLEREVHWIWMFAGASLLVITGLSFWIALTLTQRLIEPVVAIEKHMRELVMGRWNVPDFNPGYEEFKELTFTYEYLYRSLKTMTEEELKLLDQIVVDPHHREAWGTWIELVNLKRKRLGYSVFNPALSASLAEADPLRRVS